MSSPWKRQETANATAPVHGSGGAAPDDWDLLRSTPDYDQEEMQGVSLPASYMTPLVSSPPVAAPASWTPAAPPHDAPTAPQWAPPESSPASSGAVVPTAPQERWPEAAGVANLAGDLFAGAQGEGLWRPMDEGSTAFQVAAEETEEDTLDWSAILARAEDISGDAGDGMTSESWAFLPDAMLQGGDGGVDLLSEALAAGAKAGLLDAGARLEAEERPAATRSKPAAEGELPDLLDAALSAGERAGLMGR